MGAGSYQRSFWGLATAVNAAPFMVFKSMGEVELVITSFEASASADGQIYVQMELYGQQRALKYGTRSVEIKPTDGIYLGVGELPTFQAGGAGEGPPPGTVITLMVFGRIIDTKGKFEFPAGFTKQNQGRPGGLQSLPLDGSYYLDIRTKSS